ncbi:hypothetical protein GCM10011533_09480 [Streptosporangium jomthongense]|nr:hypothetical protein GCM10011533_09480 [Streptosporangium jomthongense]
MLQELYPAVGNEEKCLSRVTLVIKGRTSGVVDTAEQAIHRLNGLRRQPAEIRRITQNSRAEVR